jgi:PAS domain S-box-containing protein
MVRVLGCLVEQHNLWLVAVASVICVLCWAGALLVMDRARSAANNNRLGWLVLAALAAGGGAWATHFVGILAYEPGIPTTFDFGIALLSAAIGVGGALAAFALFARWSDAWVVVAAGLLMGGTIAGVHHVGMAGIGVAAQRVWASDLLIASTLFAAAFSVLGFWTLASAESFLKRASAGALFALGVLSMHFTGVGALTLVPHPLTEMPEQALDHTGLAIMIVVGAAALLIAAATFSFADRRIAAVRLANAARFSRLAEAALEGLVIHDGDTILDANTALAKMVGADVSDLVGNTMRSFVAPDSLPALQAAARGERPYPVEATLVSPVGLVEVEIHRRVLNAAEGTYVSAVRDISVRRRAERAEKADSAKSQFLANMSHELRTPLNAIIGYSELVMEESEEPETRADVGRVLASAKHLLTLLNEVLDLSKIEAGRMEMTIEDGRIAGVVGDVADTMRAQVEGKGLAFDIAVDAKLEVRADMFRLKQCLLNLVSNAVKFTESGKVRVSAERVEGGLVRVLVRDSGMGMTPSQLSKLFGAYAQADATVAAKFGGTGLGLAITKRLVSLMDGEIHVESIVGVGTTFEILLPAPAFSKVRPSVLIIDDDRDAASLVMRALEAVGMDARAAYDGVSGLAIARTTRPDLVIVDIHLPDMSGWDVLAEIRMLNGPPVMVHSVDDARRRANAAGAAAFFQKPAPRDALTAAALRLASERAGRDTPTLLAAS